MVTPYTEPYARYSDHGAAWFLGRTLGGLLAASGLDKDDIDGIAITSMTLAPDSAPAMVDHFGLQPRWLASVPFGGASGLIALQRAARAVQSGDASVVACIAGDTLQKNAFADLVRRFSRFSMDAVQPYGAAGPNAVFALITDAYMRRYSVRREAFGHLCIAQRENAMANTNALLREPLGMEDYMSARPVAEPLHLYDCVMPCAGGEGFLVMSEDRAAELNVPRARLRAMIERHNAYSGDSMQLRGGWAMDADALYDQAGVGPGDMHFVQTYDDYPVISFLQLEALGLCEQGKAAGFFEPSAHGGGTGIPHNTGGGQLSVGQAGFAGGFLGLVEALRQLTGQPLGRALANAGLGLVSGFGFVNYDRGICTAAAIVERSS